MEKFSKEKNWQKLVQRKPIPCGSFITSSFIVYFFFKDYFENDFLFLIILVISAISQFGDIFISYLKRKNKKKDTGSILPGHGGLLDRFDGIIFTLSSGILLKSIVLWKKLLS